MLLLPMQVEFILWFWTPIPAGSGGKLALVWLTSTGKRIAHSVVAQAELQPVLDFLELCEVMSQTSPRRQLAVSGAQIQLWPVPSPGDGSWEGKDVSVCAVALGSGLGHWMERASSEESPRL